MSRSDLPVRRYPGTDDLDFMCPIISAGQDVPINCCAERCPAFRSNNVQNTWYCTLCGDVEGVLDDIYIEMKKRA
jgi:hypothetical protein